MLEADEHHDWSSVGDRREELFALRPLLGLECFDRRACNRALRDLATGTGTILPEGSRR